MILVGAVLAILGSIVGIAGYRYFRGTTLTAVVAWCVVAWLAMCCLLVVMDRSVSVHDAHEVESWRLIVAALLFAPTTALLGAKRPQHGAWQWIVMSLCAIVALPAGEALLYGRAIEVGAVRSWFMLVLILMGLANHVLTSNWSLALGYSLLQWYVASPFLPLPEPSFAGSLVVIVATLVAFIAAAVVQAVSLKRRHRDIASWQKGWSDFRDAFGAVWALRVAQRFNATAVQHHWPVRLGWFGLEPTPNGPRQGQLADPVDPDAARELRSLLLRFVSPDWISVRVGAD